MRKIILAVSLILAFRILPAQVMIGLKAALTSSYLRTNIDNRPSTTIDRAYGYALALPVYLRVNKYLYLSTSPDFIQKNYSIDRTDSLRGAYTRINNDYLQLPILAQFVYGKRLQIFFNSGGYIAYWSRGRLTGKTPGIFSVSDAANSSGGQQSESFQLIDFNQKYIFNSQRDKRVELGWAASAGVRYRLTDRYLLVLECSYYQSLTDQQKKYMIGQTPQYNETFAFSASTLYSLK